MVKLRSKGLIRLLNNLFQISISVVNIIKGGDILCAILNVILSMWRRLISPVINHPNSMVLIRGDEKGTSCVGILPNNQQRCVTM